MAPRIRPLEPTATPADANAVLRRVESALGTVPNLHRTLAHAPAALTSYTAMASALGAGRLQPQLREQLAIAVAAQNGCSYCAAAHTLLGRRAGVTPDELGSSLRGGSDDPKTDAALQFALQLLQHKGRVTDQQLDAVRRAGFDDGEIVEIVAHVGMNTFTNMFNELARTDIDFPAVELPTPGGPRP